MLGVNNLGLCLSASVRDLTLTLLSAWLIMSQIMWMIDRRACGLWDDLVHTCSPCSLPLTYPPCCPPLLHSVSWIVLRACRQCAAS